MEANSRVTIRLTGYLSLIQSGIFLLGMVFYIMFLLPITFDLGVVSVDQIGIILDHKNMLQSFYGMTYIVFSVLLLFLNSALCRDCPNQVLTSITRHFGIVWSVLLLCSGLFVITSFEYIALADVENSIKMSTLAIANLMMEALGGGNELIGGLWVGSMSIILRKAFYIGRTQWLLGLVIGGIGVITVFPKLSELGAFFGIGMIIWFAALGVTKLKPGERLYV
ncbi:hypothetical protein [Marinomonas balearica]|uniref:DUF4386 family protein n=1 Tax=Marinomonas balearica TaxID=491947 RepID=A0A4R6MEY8_9GAMM|nr:hypothetical protein [Marinomonas balearica]TDO98649.1 hypothetical protein DFP79_1061 [Marinomonas balearica]